MAKFYIEILIIATAAFARPSPTSEEDHHLKHLGCAAQPPHGVCRHSDPETKERGHMLTSTIRDLNDSQLITAPSQPVSKPIPSISSPDVMKPAEECIVDAY